MAAAQLERILANLLVPDNTVIQQVKSLNSDNWIDILSIGLSV